MIIIEIKNALKNNYEEMRLPIRGVNGPFGTLTIDKIIMNRLIQDKNFLELFDKLIYQEVITNK